MAMLERTDLKPVFFAPFVSSVMQVEPEWIDYNGHMNVAYYTALFDRAFDEALQLLGAGTDYVKRDRHSYFTAESHARYLRELLVGTPVRVTVQLLGYDAKRLHLFQQLYHATEGWMAATLETLALHVDVGGKKAVAAPPHVAERLAEMRRAHALLPIPEAAGRRIKMPAQG
jgi:acyl-CoA thioester hydrolase